MDKITQTLNMVRMPAFLLAILLVCLPNILWAVEKPLVFGILPADSPVALLKRFGPLREHLQVSLGRSVKLETARDFPEYARRTRERFYDIVFTAPHMAIPALDSRVYELAATFNKPLKAVIVVSENSAFTKLADLGGKRFATPPKQAIITMVGKQYLEKSGLFENKATRLSPYRNHNAAYQAAKAGEVDAAIIANFMYLKAVKQKIGIRKISESEGFPGIGILIASDLDPALKKSVTDILVSMKDSADGKELLQKISQPGYVKAAPSQFEPLRPFMFKPE